MKARKLIYIIIATAALLLLLTIYYCVNPETALWVPKCSIKTFTGYDCPACGTQRALHALLHGRFLAALRYNLFMIVSIPYFAAVIYTTIGKSATAARMRKYVQHRYAIYTYIFLFIVWWIIRNIYSL